MLEQIGLQRARDLPAGVLTYAEQRALEIGITIAGGADVILLDEPTAGMSRETDAAVELIRKVTVGKTLIMVEHDMGVVFGLADQIAVLVYGEVIATGTPEEIRANARAGSLPGHDASQVSTTLLEVKNLHAYYGKSHILHGVHLRVGAGRDRQPARAQRRRAARPPSRRSWAWSTATGSVQFKGEEMLGLKTYEIAHKGLGYVPENRDIFPDADGATEPAARAEEAPAAGGRWTLDDMYALFPRLQGARRCAAGVLSGGEQQMLTLCRTLMGDPELVMIDEPTEGLAPKIVELVARVPVGDEEARRVDPAGRAEADHRAGHLRARCT